MIRFLYEAALWILAILAIPKTLYSFFVYKKYRESLLPRLGVGGPALPSPSRPSIWIHATSVGETKAAAPLARELKQRFPEYPLIISSTTETGHAEAKRSLPFADAHLYLPFDFRWAANRIIEQASPRLVLLCESDFWFNFLSCAKQKGAALALVNGKLSERSMQRFSWFPFFSRKLFGLLDRLCLQNTLYQNRFERIGVPLERMVVTGNLKLDEDYPQLSQEEAAQWRQKLGIESGQPLLTIGSTHAPEEQLFLPVLKELWKHTPELRVILVPRRPELFKEVGALLERERIAWLNFTDICRHTGKEQVILMDAMGLLRMCYQLSDFAVVGGSFVDHVGGHNILEPCWYGKPVLFGPHMEAQLELVELVTRYGAGRQTSLSQLLPQLRDWIDRPEEGKALGANGLRLVRDLKGSTQRTLQALEPLLAAL